MEETYRLFRGTPLGEDLERWGREWEESVEEWREEFLEEQGQKQPIPIRMGDTLFFGERRDGPHFKHYLQHDYALLLLRKLAERLSCLHGHDHFPRSIRGKQSNADMATDPLCYPWECGEPLSAEGDDANATLRERHAHTLLRPVYVNAVEVGYAYSQSDKDKRLSVRGVTIALWHFLSKGHQVVALLPYCFKTYPDKSSCWSELIALYKMNLVEFTPGYGSEKYVEVNRILVNRAKDTGGCIVARSQMHNIVEERPVLDKTVEKRLLMPSFNGNDIIFPMDGPLGRIGPTLNTTLQCSVDDGEWGRCSHHQLLLRDQKIWLTRLAQLFPEMTTWVHLANLIHNWQPLTPLPDIELAAREPTSSLCRIHPPETNPAQGKGFSATRRNYRRPSRPRDSVSAYSYGDAPRLPDDDPFLPSYLRTGAMSDDESAGDAVAVDAEELMVEPQADYIGHPGSIYRFGRGRSGSGGSAASMGSSRPVRVEGSSGGGSDLHADHPRLVALPSPPTLHHFARMSASEAVEPRFQRINIVRSEADPPPESRHYDRSFASVVGVGGSVVPVFPVSPQPVSAPLSPLASPLSAEMPGHPLSHGPSSVVEEAESVEAGLSSAPRARSEGEQRLTQLALIFGWNKAKWVFDRYPDAPLERLVDVALQDEQPQDPPPSPPPPLSPPAPTPILSSPVPIPPEVATLLQSLPVVPVVAVPVPAETTPPFHEERTQQRENEVADLIDFDAVVPATMCSEPAECSPEEASLLD